MPIEFSSDYRVVVNGKNEYTTWPTNKKLPIGWDTTDKTGTQSECLDYIKAIRPYRVVINHEEQYSIWPTDRDLPGGWDATGKIGTKEECLASIAEVWTDTRPKSMRDYEAARRRM